ncbi:putative endonuclease exonuclease phosphatase [Lyophyllum shimeji]|uniref:Endonuclease exonuclease phosphatase n=1 Tax=Lyophyllum shimeji TaxID=47721 RepID=A0A9P3UME5_LYOSH|nr:putative endonuclease exonuclease phosphatase [Lyophyllum shimeji]
MASKSASKRHQLSSEQLALSEKRKAKKQKSAAPPRQPETPDAGRIVERNWIPIHEGEQGTQRIKVFTWNLLAQCLVRRDLFPTSNCLKAGQREHMLYRELLATEADVLCLQEVDRLEKLLPVLEQAGYAYHYAAGPAKKHGCLIAFKEELYTMLSTKTVHYDDEAVRSDGDEKARRGKSFHTRNIGSLVSLQSKSAKNEGVIVATTHLFWHPKYTYERARQAGILVRETRRLQFRPGRCCVFSFIHVSVDPTIPKILTGVPEEGNEEAVDPDRAITNARRATPDDGLLSPADLVEFFSRIPRVRSVYDVGLSKVADLSELQTFGSRATLGPSRRGKYEPAYTSYTHYWKAVLDYIFVLDPVDRRSTVVSLLSPHRTADLEPGLPQKGVSGSDHVSLAAELCWPKIGTL